MVDKVSVIMSCYNEDIKWIDDSIESILKQTYKNLEFIIVIDNPSNKEIYECVKNHAMNDERIKYILNKNNIGLVESLNKAIQISTGEFIARMDADDISEIDRIEKQINFLKQNPTIDIIGTKAIYINEHNMIIRKDFVSINSLDKVAKILENINCLLHPTWLVKREVYIELGGYRNLNRVEDYDFLLRALTHGFNLGILNEPLLRYRVRSNSISRTNLLEQYLGTLYCKKLYKERLKKNKDSYDYRIYTNFISDRCTNKNMMKYKYANELFLLSGEYIRSKKYLKGLILLIRSCLKSKYQFMQFLDFFKYKILLNV